MTISPAPLVASLALLAWSVPAAAQSVWRDADGRGDTARLQGSFLALQDDAARQTARLARQRKSAETLRGQEARRQAQQRVIDGWPEVTERVTHRLRLGRNATFELRNEAGNIVITGGRGDDIRIEATKRARHRSGSVARTVLPELRIDVVERGGNVELRTEQPRRRDVWTAVDYVVSVPNGANIVLGVGSGNVRISNVAGEVRVDANDGNLVAAGVRRVRHLRTMRGDIEVSNAEADELSATTVQGDVMLRNLKGRVLESNSVDGDVRLVDVQMHRARLQTTVGNIEYAGPLARSGRYEFMTHSGDIRLAPSGGAGFDVQAQSVAGDIRTDYVLKRLDDFARRIQRGAERTLRGTFGDAGAVLTARSFSGDILIVRK